jgi:hypothetical protein
VEFGVNQICHMNVKKFTTCMCMGFPQFMFVSHVFEYSRSAASNSKRSRKQNPPKWI